MTASDDDPTTAETKNPWERRLRCPHCQEEFDYAFVPGASVTAVRLGTSRYMRCPLCHRYAVFSLRAPPAGASSASPTPLVRTAPRFSDRRTLARWGIVLLVPATALVLLGGTLVAAHPAGWDLIIGGVVALGTGAVLLLAFGRPERTR